MTELVSVAKHGAVFQLTLNRPDKKNALNDAMYAALADGLQRAASDADIRVILLDAAGADFCAGNDIGDFIALAARGQALADGNAARFLGALLESPKPVVAAVQGRAIGIGLTLLLHCDLVWLGASAQLSAPFVRLGVVPEAGSSLLLPALLGRARALEVFALGRVLGATEAVQCGLANACVSDAALAEHARSAAEALAALPQQALAATRRLLVDRETLRERMRVELALFAERLRSPEAQRVFAAFSAR